MRAERVIFRTEYNPYTKRREYLAVFPDDPANPGRIGAVEMHVREKGTFFFPYGEIALAYYYNNTRLVHKDNSAIPDLLRAVEGYYDCKFKVCEKIRTRR